MGGFFVDCSGSDAIGLHHPNLLSLFLRTPYTQKGTMTTAATTTAKSIMDNEHKRKQTVSEMT